MPDGIKDCSGLHLKNFVPLVSSFSISQKGSCLYLSANP